MIWMIDTVSEFGNINAEIFRIVHMGFYHSANVGSDAAELSELSHQEF